jgi:hypothetical protein
MFRSSRTTSGRGALVYRRSAQESDRFLAVVRDVDLAWSLIDARASSIMRTSPGSSSTSSTESERAVVAKVFTPTNAQSAEEPLRWL